MRVTSDSARRRASLSALLAAVFLLLFAVRGNLQGVWTAITAPRIARPARALPPAYLALLAKAAALVPPGASIAA